MEIKELIEKITRYFNCEITGSFKFYSLGLLEKYNDIDIITTSEEKSKIIEFIKDFGFYQAYETEYQKACSDRYSYVHKWRESDIEKAKNTKVYFDYFTNGKEQIHFVIVKKIEKINDYDVICGMYKRGTEKDYNNIIEICKKQIEKTD